MVINSTYSIAGNQQFKNPIIPNERILAVAVKGDIDNYRVGDLVKRTVAIPFTDNQIIALRVDAGSDTNASLKAPDIIRGIISCIKDKHGCEYQEVDIDGTIITTDDIYLNVMWFTQDGGEKVEAKMPLVSFANGGVRQALVETDFMVSGALLEGIVVARNADSQNPIVQFN